MSQNKKTKLENTLEELFKIRNPHTDNRGVDVSEYKKKINKKSKIINKDLPISEKGFLELVTSRNRDLIKKHEQIRLHKTVVGFFGLSVGTQAALSWMMLSRARDIKVVDPDTIDVTNLNRLPFGLDAVGGNKVDLVKRKLVDINPLASVETYTQTKKNKVKEIVMNDPKLDILVDEIDDIGSKYHLRKLAKKKGIPLISAADVGDNVVLDIERYDSDPSTKPFLGRIDIDKTNFDELTDQDKKKLIIKLVGFKENSERMLESLLSIGGTIPTWPQLGPTAQIAGGVVALTIKNIILEERIESGRYYLSLDRLLIADHDSKKKLERRRLLIDTLKKMIEE